MSTEQKMFFDELLEDDDSRKLEEIRNIYKKFNEGFGVMLENADRLEANLFEME